jgi:RND superfamily putative drug exporter
MHRDQGRVERLVLLGVSIVLIVLLRQLVVPLFLLASVLLSYFATLGMTFVVFWAMDPTGFVGLDWKETVFLFAILIAVGED